MTPSRDTDPRAGVPNFFKNDKSMTYRRVSVFDSAGESLLRYFKPCIEFIDQSKHHGSILVHCLQGISRSTSIIVAYLMQSKRMSMDDALAHIRSRRPIAKPNTNFKKQLRIFETMCQAAREKKRRRKKGKTTVSGPRRPCPAARTSVGPSVGPAVGLSVGPSVGPSPGPSVGPSKGPVSVAAAGPCASAGPSPGPSVQPSVGPSVGPSPGPSVGPSVRPPKGPVSVGPAGPCALVSPPVGPSVGPAVGPSVGPSSVKRKVTQDSPSKKKLRKS